MPQELTLEVVAPGVYAVLSPPGHLAAANAGIVVLEDAVLVIDTHMVPSAARELLTKLHSVTDLHRSATWSTPTGTPTTLEETKPIVRRFPTTSFSSHTTRRVRISLH